MSTEKLFTTTMTHPLMVEAEVGIAGSVHTQTEVRTFLHLLSN